jgi:hypothetical protein
MYKIMFCSDPHELLDDLLVIESLEQLQKVIDPACLPPDLNGTGLAYDDGAFASMLHIL